MNMGSQNLPLISIIVPVWNVESFLPKCLNSLLGQTYDNLEILLVDDGSTDSSGLICDAFARKDRRIKVIHQENAGVSAARNRALAVATGEYLGFVDPDDWCAPDMFEYLYNGLKKYNADVSACRYFRVVPGRPVYSNCDGVDQLFSRDGIIANIVTQFDFRVVFWNKLFCRRLFEGVRFPEGAIFEGLRAMPKILLKVDRVVYLGYPKYYYYDNSESYINNWKLSLLLDRPISFISQYNDLFQLYPELEEVLLSNFIRSLIDIKKRWQYIPRFELKQCAEKFREISDFAKLYVFSNPKANLTFGERLMMRLISSGFPLGITCAFLVGGIVKILGLKNTRANPVAKRPCRFNEMPPSQRETLDCLHEELLKIMDDVDRICRKHGLNYYLYGGTLLGAVRHGGFIPWDDDVDIVMPRADYQKFGEICKKELSDRYFWQTCFSDPAYPMLFAKIRKNGTFVRERKWDNRKMHKGIYVDILPLDEFPDNSFRGALILKIMSFLHQTCAFTRSHSRLPIARLLFRIMKLTSPLFRYRVRDWVMRYSNRHGGGHLVCSFGSHYQPMSRRVLKKEWFGTPHPIKFEGHDFLAPAGTEDYLLHLFGEKYMEMPPPELQMCHGDLDSVLLGG